VLACAAAVLAAGAAGLFAAARRAHALSRWLSRRHHRSGTIARLAAAVAGLSRQRAGPGLGAGVLACTGTGLLADAGVLAACFGLAGLPVPWRGLLFAYAAGQLAGRLVPLPGGIGGMEGGVLGALTLTGTPPAAAAAAVIVYRVAGYWTVGAAGTAVAATLARRRPRGTGRDAPQQPLRRRGGGCEPKPLTSPSLGHHPAPPDLASRRRPTRRPHDSARSRRGRFHRNAHQRVMPNSGTGSYRPSKSQSRPTYRSPHASRRRVGDQ
jgi:hypothetical protein